MAACWIGRQILHCCSAHRLFIQSKVNIYMLLEYLSRQEERLHKATLLDLWFCSQHSFPQTAALAGKVENSDSSPTTTTKLCCQVRKLLPSDSYFLLDTCGSRDVCACRGRWFNYKCAKCDLITKPVCKLSFRLFPEYFVKLLADNIMKPRTVSC